MQVREEYQFHAFVVITKEATYRHASTLCRYNGNWYWLDSEKTSRAVISGGGMEAYLNMQDLRDKAYEVCGYFHANSLAECRNACLNFPPIRHPRNASLSPITILDSPTPMPSSEVAKRPAPGTATCTTHIINRYSKQELVNASDVYPSNTRGSTGLEKKS